MKAIAEAVARPPRPTLIVWRDVAVASVLAFGWALLVRPGPLSLPYFWDEADVYARGAKWLAENGLNATPGVFPDDWSRGHPPLFYLLAGICFRIWSTAPAVAHALMIPFTALALVSTYILGTLRGGRLVGVLAALLLGATPLFMSMGAFLLPEMPLAALTVLALVLAERRAFVGAAIVGCVLVWIKETGVCTPLAIAGGLVLQALATGRFREARRAVLLSLSPVLALAAFFVWQRLTAGYFVFPHHQNLFAERPFTLWNAFTVFPSTLLWHGRIWATFAALLATAVFFFRSRDSKTRLSELSHTDAAIVLLLLGNAIFFAKMFWLERYALPAHPGICVLTALVTAHACVRVRLSPFVAAVPIGAASIIGFNSLNTRGEAPEHTFAFAEEVRSHQAAYRAIQSQNAAAAVLTTWPLTTELREPWLGYVETSTNAFHPDDRSTHPEAPTAILIDPTSTHAPALRTEAARRAMHRTPAQPPLELWIGGQIGGHVPPPQAP